MLVFGLEMYIDFGLPKVVLPVQHMDVCVILFGFCGLIISGELLKQLEAF